jgi:uncharacterized protein YdeI (YjbR/CyaY-like superfamily)
MSATPTPGRDLPLFAFPDAEAWRAWLDANHSASQGIWMRIAKSRVATASVTYPEAVEVALCFGWIDGRKAALDDRAWLQKFTPRRARSRWSKINRGRAEDLIDDGLMSPAGLAEVERAKADGRWDSAYDSPVTATVPDDLAAALAGNAGAAEAFARLDGRNRYAILYRIQDARRPETRARRIATFVEMLADGRTPH